MQNSTPSSSLSRLSMQVSLTIKKSSLSRFSLSARIFTCEQLSSAEKYKTRCSRDRWAAICVSRVDLPMPGSPPSSTSEPETIPPPSTVSNSEMPEGVLSYLSNLTLVRRCARGAEYSPPRAFAAAGFSSFTASSAMVLNFPQAGHLPSHLGLVAPHSAHTNIVPFFAIILKNSLQ